MKSKFNKSVVSPSQFDGNSYSRRSFLSSIGIGAMALGIPQMSCSPKEQKETIPDIQGFERSKEEDPSEGWAPFSERKVKVGLVGSKSCPSLH